MLKAMRRAWRYLGTALGMKFEEAADPKVQLEQAIQDAQEQHRRLTEQAANVIANQKQTEMRLTRALEEVRDKIERRYAKALGTSELQGQTVESRMLEVEQAAMDQEAQQRLGQIRSQLGIAAPAQPEPTPATEPAPQEGGTATT